MKAQKTDEAGTPMASLENRVRDILVVENEAVLRNFVVAALQREGYRVIGVATAKEAERFILGSINPKEDVPYFDVIISDDQLDDGMGSDLLLYYRTNHPILNNSYMLLMSGTYRDEKRDEGFQELKKHSIDYLCKVEGDIIERIRGKMKIDARAYFAEINEKNKSKKQPEQMLLPHGTEIPKQAYQQSPQTTNSS